MKNNFQFKKAIDSFSKVGPADRCDRLSKFISTFNRNESVQAELNSWRMNFSDKPVELNARVLPLETLGFGRNTIRKLNDKADWNNDMKEIQLLNTISLSKWVVIFPCTKKGTANDFVNIYGQIISSLGIRAQPPDE